MIRRSWLMRRAANAVGDLHDRPAQRDAVALFRDLLVTSATARVFYRCLILGTLLAAALFLSTAL